MTTSFDDLLIGVFLSISIAFIILWGVAILKWRKKFLHAMVPCFAKKKKKKKFSTVKAEFTNKADNAHDSCQAAPQIAVISDSNLQSNPVKYANEQDMKEKKTVNGEKFINPGYEESSEMGKVVSPSQHVNIVNKSKPTSSSCVLANVNRDKNNNWGRPVDCVERIDVKPLDNDIHIKVDVVEVEDTDEDDNFDNERVKQASRQDTIEDLDDSNPFKEDDDLNPFREDIAEEYSTPASMSKFSHPHLDRILPESSATKSSATCIILNEVRL